MILIKTTIDFIYLLSNNLCPSRNYTKICSMVTLVALEYAFQYIVSFELFSDRLYFATLSSHQKPSSSTICHFFNTDEELVYNK